MISGGIEVNIFAKIRLLMEVKFRDNPYSNLKFQSKRDRVSMKGA